MLLMSLSLVPSPIPTFQCCTLGLGTRLNVTNHSLSGALQILAWNINQFSDAIIIS